MLQIAIGIILGCCAIGAGIALVAGIGPGTFPCFAPSNETERKMKEVPIMLQIAIGIILGCCAIGAGSVKVRLWPRLARPSAASLKAEAPSLPP